VALDSALMQVQCPTICFFPSVRCNDQQTRRPHRYGMFTFNSRCYRRRSRRLHRACRKQCMVGTGRTAAVAPYLVPAHGPHIISVASPLSTSLPCAASSCFRQSIRNTYGENEHGTQRQTSVRQHGTEKWAPPSGTAGAAAVREHASALQRVVYSLTRFTTPHTCCIYTLTLCQIGHSTQLSYQCRK